MFERNIECLIFRFFDAWKLLVTRRNQQEIMKQTVQTGRMRNCFVSWRERLNVKMKLLNAGERYDANLQLKVIKSWTKVKNIAQYNNQDRIY